MALKQTHLYCLFVILPSNVVLTQPSSKTLSGFLCDQLKFAVYLPFGFRDCCSSLASFGLCCFMSFAKTKSPKQMSVLLPLFIFDTIMLKINICAKVLSLSDHRSVTDATFRNNVSCVKQEICF